MHCIDYHHNFLKVETMETLSEFYAGKTIFTTGAAGFLGTYLLQLLLTCFPGIVRIYILIRSKQGHDPIERKEQILKKKIFRKICENNPELLDKIHVIPGDISKPNLGMSEEDMRKICEEVTVVFHGAASVSFTQPYRSICFQNAKSTDYVIDLCKRLKKLDVLVYTSTAYANCHRYPKTIEEKVYTLPFSAERFIEEMENGTDESFDELVSSLESKFNLKWPNSYTFSKCLTENLLLEKASDLPVAIVRPSIVFTAYKGVRPVLVYTSTAYANCHRYPKTIEEKVYTLPFSAERFIEEMENGTDESFDELVSSLESKFNLKWPNSYTFSKCLTENLLLEKASDLPVAIVRPSIVFTAYKGVRPGYIDEGTGVTDLSVGVGKGFVKVIRGDSDSIFDVVPIDVCANCHVLVAWCVATGRRPSMFVVHNTLGDKLKLKFGQYLSIMYDLTVVHPLPNSFQEMSFIMVKSKLMYKIIALYRHYIPAAVIDLYLSYKGSKLRLVKLYRFFDKMTEKLYYFMSTSFNFQTVNLHGLTNELQPEEKKLFYLDLGGASFAVMVENMPFGSEIFDWERDKLPQKKRQKIVYVRTMVITFIKRFTLLLFILVLYFTISKVFF
ncbi:fatty acyl-CoA reductase 1 [Parasteatoda tepidariorum]|uniref:fatty acyl-CoA reductase 1 n=1 Tax=Parasteatoda tepidariorum TaxID=114398 RepID=UPI0039BC22A9